MADLAVVFCRGFIDSANIRKTLSTQIGIDEKNVWVLRKIGANNDEILILLRNPYGGGPEVYNKKGTLECRLYTVITLAMRYMQENVEDLFYEAKPRRYAAETRGEMGVGLTPRARNALSKFFFGPEGFVKNNFGRTSGFVFELKEARRRLRDGEKPFFLYPIRIYPKGNRVKENNERKDCRRDKDENLSDSRFVD